MIGAGAPPRWLKLLFLLARPVEGANVPFSWRSYGLPFPSRRVFLMLVAVFLNLLGDCSSRCWWGSRPLLAVGSLLEWLAGNWPGVEASVSSCVLLCTGPGNSGHLIWNWRELGAP